MDDPMTKDRQAVSSALELVSYLVTPLQRTLLLEVLHHHLDALGLGGSPEAEMVRQEMTTPWQQLSRGETRLAQLVASSLSTQLHPSVGIF